MKIVTFLVTFFFCLGCHQSEKKITINKIPDEVILGKIDSINKKYGTIVTVWEISSDSNFIFILNNVKNEFDSFRKILCSDMVSNQSKQIISYAVCFGTDSLEDLVTFLNNYLDEIKIENYNPNLFSSFFINQESQYILARHYKEYKVIKLLEKIKENKIVNKDWAFTVSEMLDGSFLSKIGVK